jgi:hypothetical protein
MSSSPSPSPFPPTRFAVWKQRITHLFETHPVLFIAIVLMVTLGDALLIYAIRTAQRPALHHVTGYISDVATLQVEYAHYHVEPRRADEIQRQFQQAAAWTDRGNFSQAAQLLDAASKDAPLPVIFNDLGLLYEKLNDPGHAIHSFQQALAKDANYGPVRANLNRFKSLSSQVADTLGSEVEPNDSLRSANAVTVDQPLEAEIKDVTDVDYFSFVTPAPPRDRFEISIVNRSKTLAPHLRLFDSQELLMPLGSESHEPGESSSLVFSPEPNSTFYLNIFGEKDSSGAYTLTVKALKSFDRFEPNDEIYRACKIAVGQSLDANIMDGDDTDYYSFESPRTGTVSIDVENHSSVLIPALTTFTPDMRTSGFGPDVRAAASLHHKIPVEQGKTYYLQVWSQAKTSGDYSLIVR